MYIRGLTSVEFMLDLIGKTSSDLKYLGYFLILLYFSCDFATPHFAMFFDQIFKLQLLAQFLADFPKI